jgi:hypothetical protein
MANLKVKHGRKPSLIQMSPRIDLRDLPKVKLYGIAVAPPDEKAHFQRLSSRNA